MMPAAALISTIYPLYTAGDFAALKGLLSHDFRISETLDAPWGGNYAGEAGVWQFWHNLAQHFALQVEVERLLECRHDVLATGTLTGLSRSTGETVAVPFVHVWAVRKS